MDDYLLILSQMLLRCTGSGDISLVKDCEAGSEAGVSAVNSRRKDW